MHPFTFSARIKTRLLLLLASLTTALLVIVANAIAAPPGQTPGQSLPLQEAIRTGQVDAWAEPIGMGFRQPMMYLHVTNRIGTSLAISVPLGTRLIAPDSGFADLVVCVPVECNASSQTDAEINAFSLSHDRGFPSATGMYTYTVGALEDEDILKLLDKIGAQSAPDHFGAQLAVWSVSEGRPLDQLVADFGSTPMANELEEAQCLLEPEVELPPDPLFLLALVVVAVVTLAIVMAAVLSIRELWHQRSQRQTTIEPEPQRTSQGRSRRPTPIMSEEKTSRTFRLVCTSGPLAGRNLELQEQCLISRGPVDWVIIPDSAVSVPHVAFDLSQIPYRVKDLNSKNGVQVRNVRLGNRFKELALGQDVTLGSLSMVASEGVLRVIRGTLAGKSYAVPASLVIVSREEIPVITTGPNDTHISDAHALFYLDEQTLWVKDLNSSNGTWVNQQRTQEETVLRSGDKLKLGFSEFEVQKHE